MGKGRPSAERSALMLKVLTEAYEKLKNGNPSFEDIIYEANKFDAVRLSKEGKIGDKTLLQSNNKDIKALRERIQSDKKKIVDLKVIAPNELFIKIEQLHSSLEANAILALKIENLEKRLKNKDEALEGKETRITKLSKEIERLRSELRAMKV